MKNADSSRPRDFVSLVLNGTIRIEAVTTLLADELLRLGGQRFTEGGEVWSLPYDGEGELAGLLDHLNRLGVLFEGQPAGWPPSAIFEDLRDKNLLSGSFREVTWSGSGKWFVRSR